MYSILAFLTFHTMLLEVDISFTVLLSDYNIQKEPLSTCSSFKLTDTKLKEYYNKDISIQNELNCTICDLYIYTLVVLKIIDLPLQFLSQVLP